MMLDLKKLLDADQVSLPFQSLLDLSSVVQWDIQPFSDSVPVWGTLEKRAGILTLCYSVSLSYQVPCARCLAPIVVDSQSLSFQHTLVSSLNQQHADDDYILVSNGVLALDDLVREDVILALPNRMLCSEDCKGLCPLCGTDLNRSSCDCSPAVDPRWDVLDTLFEND